MKKAIVCLVFSVIIIGCSSAKKRINKDLKNVFSSTFYNSQFTGLLVVNPQNQDTIINFNAEKYFTPASNTKIFTLFSALHLLSDRIPALKYVVQNDTLYIEGTGDPTLLHTSFEYNKTLAFLKQYDHIALHLNNFKDEKYGPGWSWEDYDYYYQPEKSALPMYGNVTTIHNAAATKVTPTYFKNAVVNEKSTRNRDLDHNHFYFYKGRKDTLVVPFRIDSTLTQLLLEDVLRRKITLVTQMPLRKKEMLYSVLSDSVYKIMMHESDNFIAEQLLILGSTTLSDTLSSTTTRDYILENKLGDLRQPPRWVDGSGLSRYNLFTPESIVVVLGKLQATISRERLLDFFPAGGVSGALEDWFTGNPNPYIYAKSGSLGNNYCLSGYLLTKSGKTLTFSFMNNHFRHPSSEVKKQMEQIFEKIRDNY